MHKCKKSCNFATIYNSQTMKHVLTAFLLVVCIASAQAVPMYTMEPPPLLEMRECKIMTSGVAYPTSMVYIPFNIDAPSTYCISEDDVTNPQREAAKWENIQRRLIGNFGDRPDSPPSTDPPIGEPWIMLLFALLFGGFITYRTIRYSKTNFHRDNNETATRAQRGNHVSYHTL